MSTTQVTGETITDEQIDAPHASGDIDRDLVRLARNTTGRNSTPSVAAARRVCSRIHNARCGARS